jgi:hypothetical protein
MRRAFVLLAVVMLVGATVGGASAAPPDPVVAFDAARAHVFAAGVGGPLLRGREGASAADLVGEFLLSKGKSADTVASLKSDVEFASRGVTFARLRQEVGGLRVAGAYVRAAVNGRGELIYLIENIVDVRGAVARGQATPEQALAAALARAHPGLADRPPVARQAGPVTTFRRTAAFASAPRAERVLVARVSGALEQGFLVETWTIRGNELHETLVDGAGQAVASQLRTANDNYNVFSEDPSKGPQTTIAGPGAGNAESPIGWLTGAQLTTHIAGNNANAYLDQDADNAADAGGTPVTDGNFLAAADLARPPTDGANPAVAVQNLFFHSNLVHDILYRKGFTEANGNFQENNFSLGGAGSDSVNAEAQDGSGTDNANFATPTDGGNPRMQMFLWTGAGGTHEVVVGANSYDATDAVFGPVLDTTGVSGPLRNIDDGVAAAGGGTTTDGCERLARKSLTGQIGLVDRGFCNFTVKVKNAQAAGAIGLIIANNVAGPPFVMGGSGGGFKISPVMVSQTDGGTLRGLAGSTATLRRKAVQPLQIDGDLDTDVIYHEYGHGLTWRMIGSMSGPLAGAVGEGASDTLAFLINGDDRIGEYAASSVGGIRRFPYTGYPNTYADWTGAEVHDDGEIYAAAMWRLHENFASAGLTDDALLTTFVDGMNFTPAGPAAEDMRDGMVASAQTRAPNQVCLIWDAFADYGIGVGADGTIMGQSVRITESFTVPAECAGP